MKFIILVIAALFAVAQCQNDTDWVPVLVRDFSSLPLLQSTREWGLHQTMTQLKNNGSITNVLYNLNNTEWVFNYTRADVIDWKYNCTMRSNAGDTVNDIFIVEYNYTNKTMYLVSSVVILTFVNPPNNTNTTNATNATNTTVPVVNATNATNTTNATLPIVNATNATNTTNATLPVVNATNATNTTNATLPIVNATNATNTTNATLPVVNTTNTTNTTKTNSSTVIGTQFVPTGPYTLVPTLDYRLPSVNGSVDYGVAFVAKNATAMGLIPNGTYVRSEIISIYRQIHAKYAIYNCSVGISNKANTTHFDAHFFVNHSYQVKTYKVLSFNYAVLPTSTKTK